MLGIGVDWVALSFVQKPGDIEEIHKLIDENLPEGAFKPAVMAKVRRAGRISFRIHPVFIKPMSDRFLLALIDRETLLF